MVNTPIPHSLKSECKKAGKILKEFTMPNARAGPDKLIPAGILLKAKGLAILTVVKAGFLVTARGGSDIVIAKLDDADEDFFNSDKKESPEPHRRSSESLEWSEKSDKMMRSYSQKTVTTRTSKVVRTSSSSSGGKPPLGLSPPSPSSKKWGTPPRLSLVPRPQQTLGETGAQSWL